MKEEIIRFLSDRLIDLVIEHQKYDENGIKGINIETRIKEVRLLIEKVAKE